MEIGAILNPTNPTTRNARFWAYINGSIVKITLRPGQELSWYTWHRHEEGWSSEGCTWTHDGDGVTRNWGTDGVDCDGRLATAGEDFCALDSLHAGCLPYGVEDADGIRYPAWDNVDYSRRDYQAEIAGY